MAKRFGLIAIILIAAGAVLGGLFGRAPFSAAASDGTTTTRVLNDYREAVSVIDANYVGAVDHEKITEDIFERFI